MSMDCFGGLGSKEPKHYTELKKFWNKAYKEEKISACSKTEKIVKRMFQLQAALRGVEELKKKYTCDAWKDAPKALTPCEMMHAIREKYAALEENTIAARSFFHQESSFRKSMEKYEEAAYGPEHSRILGEFRVRREQLEGHINRIAKIQATHDPWIVDNIEDRLSPAALGHAIWQKIEAIDAKLKSMGKSAKE